MPIGGGGSSSIGSAALTLIASSTAAATAASIDFQNIPQTFNHLRLVVNAKGDNPAAAGLITMRLNNDSTAIYDVANVACIGNAAMTVAGAAAATAARIGAVPGTVTTVPSSSIIDLTIPNYHSTTFYKTWAGVGGRKDADAIGNLINEIPWGSYRSTTAISRITLLSVGTGGTSQNFVAGSTAFLYGIT